MFKLMKSVFPQSVQRDQRFIYRQTTHCPEHRKDLPRYWPQKRVARCQRDEDATVSLGTRLRAMCKALFLSHHERLALIVFIHPTAG